MPIQSRELVQLPMFIETYYWGDLGQEQDPVYIYEPYDDEGWLLTGTYGPYMYATHRWMPKSGGAPWPSDTDCAEVSYETLG